MTQASDYPITFGYGAQDGYYYGPAGIIGPYHRGDDRAMPNGTPVIVNGVEIGKSNNTGASSGSHLHIGKFINGRDVDPAGGGFSFKQAVVYDTGYDGINGNYVRLQADGALWVYLHMQSVSVKAGDELVTNAELQADRDKYAEDWARLRYILAGADPSKISGADRRARINLTWDQATADLDRDYPVPAGNSPFELRQVIDKLKTASGLTKDSVLQYIKDHLS